MPLDCARQQHAPESSAHVSLQSGLDKAWGETYLLVHENELVVLTRGSVFDEYQRIQVPPRHIPTLDEGGGSLIKLVIDTLEGEKRVNVSRTEMAEAKKLIAALEKIYAA